MKKILLALGLVGALAFLPSLASAQTLTQAELESFVPQFSSALSSLSTTTTYIQNRMAAENALFGAYSNLLAAWSVRLGQPNQLSAAEIDNLSNSLHGMNQQLTVSAAWRAEVDTTIGNITQILANINSIISSAV